ncbi:hypothetical protein B0T16DRAFT_385543 [Cercophora newfieldiana]|uniref:Uncharacterized protein n=1 Tax=Cercophora newfieldiana TaxID=92897 RepID=A0AA40D065_9PEZI|nr:hypothetical protein B0T16DRAFT_385543 [Cercophora newfieldiana]
MASSETHDSKDLESGIEIIDRFVEDVQGAARQNPEKDGDVQISITNFQNTKPDNKWVKNMTKRCPHIIPLDLPSIIEGQSGTAILLVRLPKGIWELIPKYDYYTLDDPKVDTRGVGIFTLKC